MILLMMVSTPMTMMMVTAIVIMIIKKTMTVNTYYCDYADNNVVAVDK